jgi:hypothetical protein
VRSQCGLGSHIESRSIDGSNARASLQSILKVTGQPFQQKATGRQSGHYGSHRNSQHFGDFLAGQIFKLAQDQDFAKLQWQSAERFINAVSLLSKNG